jgi:hypothetical protein
MQPDRKERNTTRYRIVYKWVSFFMYGVECIFFDIVLQFELSNDSIT